MAETNEESAPARHALNDAGNSKEVGQLRTDVASIDPVQNDQREHGKEVREDSENGGGV